MDEAAEPDKTGKGAKSERRFFRALSSLTESLLDCFLDETFAIPLPGIDVLAVIVAPSVSAAPVSLRVTGKLTATFVPRNTSCIPQSVGVGELDR